MSELLGPEDDDETLGRFLTRCPVVLMRPDLLASALVEVVRLFGSDTDAVAMLRGNPALLYQVQDMNLEPRNDYDDVAAMREEKRDQGVVVARERERERERDTPRSGKT